jgi:hypothetical protein
MGLGEYCKLNGFDTIVELAQLCGLPKATLYDWYKADINALTCLIVYANMRKQVDALLNTEKARIYQDRASNRRGRTAKALGIPTMRLVN